MCCSRCVFDQNLADQKNAVSVQYNHRQGRRQNLSVWLTANGAIGVNHGNTFWHVRWTLALVRPAELLSAPPR